MATADTVKAIYANIKTIVATLGTLDNAREAQKNDESPKLGAPVYVIAYKGSDFENSVGQKPDYDVSTFDIIIRFNSGTLADAFTKQIEVVHGLKTALTVAALNVTELASSKLVSRVDVDKPEIAFTPPESRVTVSVRVRYRETE